VIERYRNQDELDAFQWYCDDCQSLVHEILVPVSDIVGQLPKLMDGFYADPQLSTCVSCGHRITKP
jgi:3-hydroxyanthranilate 3,4-dioxygenase